MGEAAESFYKWNLVLNLNMKYISIQNNDFYKCFSDKITVTDNKFVFSQVKI